MVQVKIVDPGDGVIGHPLLAGPVRARHEQAVQHAHEHRPLDIEAEPAPVEELRHHLAQPQTLPQPSEQQRSADTHAGQMARRHVRQHHRPLGMTRQRGDQPIEFATGLQDVLAPESADRPLAYPLALADALDEVEIAVPPGDLFADEHPVVVRGTVGNIKSYTSILQNCFHYSFRQWQNPNPDIALFQQLGRAAPPQIGGLLFKLGKGVFLAHRSDRKERR